MLMKEGAERRFNTLLLMGGVNLVPQSQVVEEGVWRYSSGWRERGERVGRRRRRVGRRGRER